MSAEITKLGGAKPARATKDIQLEYQNLAFKAGNLQYELFSKTLDLKQLNEQMRELNFEYVEAKNREDAAKAAPEGVADAK